MPKLNSVLFSISSLLFSLIERLFYLMEFFLFMRLILKLVDANPKAPVVNALYVWSDLLVMPFNAIFKNIPLPWGYYLETATICAMAGYAIVIFILFKLFRPLPSGN